MPITPSAVVTAARGDAGGRGGSGSRADMKLPPKRKGTPSNDHSFPVAFSPTRTRFIDMSSVLARALTAATDLFNFAAMR
jgi:hypothetical protein